MAHSLHGYGLLTDESVGNRIEFACEPEAGVNPIEYVSVITQVAPGLRGIDVFFGN